MTQFELREISVAPGGERPFAEADWRDALVLVERGEVEVECLGGARCRFVEGDLLWLTGLPLRGLRNRGACEALLIAVSRHR